jgi:hypothetical protein
MLPEMRHYFSGLDLADSFVTNAHKWLLTNFDCSCMWVRDAEPLKAALSLTPAYLRGKGNSLDYKVESLASFWLWFCSCCTCHMCCTGALQNAHRVQQIGCLCCDAGLAGSIGSALPLTEALVRAAVIWLRELAEVLEVCQRPKVQCWAAGALWRKQEVHLSLLEEKMRGISW